MKRYSLNLIATLFLFIVAHSQTFAQCAMCRASVQSNMSNGRDVVGLGLNTGILYMLMMPYILAAAIGYLWYKNSRKETLKRVALQTRVRKAFGV
jgi:hypothetical protein